MKRRLCKRIKNGETLFRTQYNELFRAVNRNTRMAKINYKIKVARDDKTNLKFFFFNMYKTKTRKRIGPLKQKRERSLSVGKK